MALFKWGKKQNSYKQTMAKLNGDEKQFFRTSIEVLSRNQKGAFSPRERESLVDRISARLKTMKQDDQLKNNWWNAKVVIPDLIMEMKELKLNKDSSAVQALLAAIKDTPFTQSIAESISEFNDYLKAQEPKVVIAPATMNPDEQPDKQIQKIFDNITGNTVDQLVDSGQETIEALREQLDEAKQTRQSLMGTDDFFKLALAEQSAENRLAQAEKVLSRSASSRP